MKIIANIKNDFTEKFGVPRQSGLINECMSEIVFTKEYRNSQALRGLEDFSHIWLIWEFSLAKREEWSPTVRPPRLGGNKRIGVFATRSPFRPNPIGLSCVKLEEIRYNTPLGPTLVVSGADLMNGTPIFDIKPYLPYADCKVDATGGFTDTISKKTLNVVISDEAKKVLPNEKLNSIKAVLRQDPRPSYQDDSARVYGLSFGGYNLNFRVEEDTLYLINAQKI